MIQPKITRYKQVVFKSRLEASWAISLDMMGCVWDYEAYSFHLQNGWQYLPDFYVHTNKETFYLEIKPAPVSDDYLQWLYNFQLDLPLYFGIGSIYKYSPIPKLYLFRNQKLHPVEYLDIFDNYRTALITAASWRFDLK